MEGFCEGEIVDVVFEIPGRWQMKLVLLQPPSPDPCVGQLLLLENLQSKCPSASWLRATAVRMSCYRGMYHAKSSDTELWYVLKTAQPAADAETRNNLATLGLDRVFDPNPARQCDALDQW